jgi:hypothetical protein
MCSDAIDVLNFTGTHLVNHKELDLLQKAARIVPKMRCVKYGPDKMRNLKIPVTSKGVPLLGLKKTEHV